MKLIFAIASLVSLSLLYSCSNKFTGVQTPAGKDWFITTHVHKKLAKKYQKCVNHPGKCYPVDSMGFQMNLEQLNYIDSTFGHPHIDTILVRYRSCDEAKYKHLWGLSRHSDAGRVRKYITKIWQITYTQADKTVPGFDRKYYLVDGDPVITMYAVPYKICPPPSPCNGSPGHP